jgi:hypothetical protein
MSTRYSRAKTGSLTFSQEGSIACLLEQRREANTQDVVSCMLNVCGDAMMDKIGDLAMYSSQAGLDTQD